MWDRFSALPRSVISLLIANLLPLVGVLFWGWSTFNIVAIYWSENIVIGLINLLKMLFCMPNDKTLLEGSLLARKGKAQLLDTVEDTQSNLRAERLAIQVLKVLYVPFFTVHYGMFCLVHGVFVFALLSGDGMGHLSGTPLDVLLAIFSRLSENHLQWAIIGLAVSHLISFFSNYLGRGEYRTVPIQNLMMQPYGRVVVLHVTILLGAGATIALGSPVWLLLILIVGKTILDVKFHLRERNKNSPSNSDPEKSS